MMVQPKFISIDGHGGSGKSTLAGLISKELKAEVIQIDDFTGMNSSDEWHKKLIKFVFEPIANGADYLNYPRAKWWMEHHPEPKVNQQVTPFMVIEGVGSLRKELRSYADFSIFVETPRNLCRKRGFERDRGLDGMNDDEIYELWDKWLDSDEVYFEKDRPKLYADLLVDGNQPLEYPISILLKQLHS